MTIILQKESPCPAFIPVSQHGQQNKPAIAHPVLQLIIRNLRKKCLPWKEMFRQRKNKLLPMYKLPSFPFPEEK